MWYFTPGIFDSNEMKREQLGAGQAKTLASAHEPNLYRRRPESERNENRENVY